MRVISLLARDMVKVNINSHLGLSTTETFIMGKCTEKGTLYSLIKANIEEISRIISTTEKAMRRLLMGRPMLEIL